MSDIDPALERLLKEINEAEADADNTTLSDDDQNNDEDVDGILNEVNASNKEDNSDIIENSDAEDEDDIDDNIEYEDESEHHDVELIESDEIELKKEAIQLKILSLLDKHYDSAEKMFDEAECDRKKIDDIFAVLMPKIVGNEYKSADVQSVASLMQTKVDISRNRSAMMDSVAKLFSALKNNDSIGSMGGSGSSNDLSKKEVEDLLNKRLSDE